MPQEARHRVTAPDRPGDPADRWAAREQPPFREGFSLLGQMAGFLRPYRGRALSAGGAAIGQAVLQLLPIVVFRALVNHLTRPHPSFATVVLLLGLGAAALVVATLLSALSGYLSTQIAEAIVYDLRQSLYEHLLDQSIGYFTLRRGGDLLSHMVSDINGIEVVLADSALVVLRELCLGVALVGLMFAFDWRLAILTLMLMPVLLVPFRLAGRASYHSQMRVRDQLAELTAHVQETLSLSGLMLVKAFSRGTLERGRFAALNDELRRRQIGASAARRWLEVGLMTLQAAGPTVLLLVGGLFVTQGSSHLGTVLAFSTIIVGQLAATAGSLSRAALATAGSMSMWQRVLRVLDQPPDLLDRPGAVQLDDVRGAVRVHGMSFTYPGAPNPALRDIDVAIEPGQFVALVGPSGAGKSTFNALLARFIDPQSGSISLDGRDLRDIAIGSLHRAVGVVFQDAFLFHDSLRENLRYGRPEASDDEIWAAAADANLDSVIAGLPDGLDTLVGERGFRLSGGEKQRVAIARVLLKNPRILLLDEATAHLDTVSERLIQSALQRLFVGRTCVVIAHRLSTVASADQLLVFDEGRIVERGNHEQLRATGGLYARLHAAVR
jgi:ATP-binding cassette subfamily B protein